MNTEEGLARMAVLRCCSHHPVGWLHCLQTMGSVAHSASTKAVDRKIQDNTVRDIVVTTIRLLEILHSVRIAATTIISTSSSTTQVPYARDLFNQYLLLPPKSVLQQSGSSGEGVRKHSGFFTFAAQLLNDDKFTTPFPKDHIPQHLTPKDSHARPLIHCRIKNVIYFQNANPKIFSPPQADVSGRFDALDILSSRKPGYTVIPQARRVCGSFFQL